MGQSKRASMIRGKSIRVTLVDANGRAVIGEDSVVATKGFLTLTYTTNSEEGEGINVTNANGDTCVSEAAKPTFTGFGVEAEFCDVDFAMFTILTGQEIVLDSSGKAIGITESTDVSIADVTFALETWTGADTKGAAASAGSQGQFGYVLTPFLTGGLISDITVENAAITFTVTGMTTKNGNAWGKGPHAVELVAGKAAPLRVGLKANDHRRIMITEVAPPAQYAGATPLLDPSDPAVTSVTATKTGLSVVFAPVPTGTDPMFYDLGDGTWDYSETGAYTHVYKAAGSYDVIARRGTSTVTTKVVVTGP